MSNKGFMVYPKPLFLLMLKLAVLPLLLVCISLLLFSKHNAPLQKDPFQHAICEGSFVSIHLPVGEVIEQAVINYLIQSNRNFQHYLTSLVPVTLIESPGGFHLTLEQTYHDIPIFNSQLKVNLNRHHEIKSVFDNSYSIFHWSKNQLQEDLQQINATGAKSYFQKLLSLKKDQISVRPVIAVLDEHPEIFVEVEILDTIRNQHRLLLVDRQLQVRLDRNLAVYFADTLVEAAALVFIPDPLTSAHAAYGTFSNDPFQDNNDADAPELNDERQPVTITVTYNGSVYLLENDYVALREFSAPVVPPVVESTPVFHYTRSESGFEDVNVLYHITEYQKYVQSLGYTNLMNSQIRVDAHAMNGDDQSQFIGGSNPSLYFGEGGIDDAEDADVIIHEYGHALSYSASPNTNNGYERRSIDEALGDYLAASYSKAIDPFNWQKVFNWDGNDTWSGRTVTTNKIYPDDLVNNSIHLDGEIYSTALMEIWDHIGREETDKILLQSLYGLASNMSMKQAAMLLFEADSTLNQGANFCIIYSTLLKRGLTDTLEYNPCRLLAGADKTICKGDTVILGDIASYKSSISYSWFPSLHLSNASTLVTKAFPDQTTQYIVSLELSDGSIKSDTVIITVNECSIQLTNTQMFLSGGEISIQLPDGANNPTLELFDITGKRLVNTELSGTQLTFVAEWLPAGIYVLRLKTGTLTKTFKLLKAR